MTAIVAHLIPPARARPAPSREDAEQLRYYFGRHNRLMETLPSLGRMFFAIALAAFGIEQFIVRDFVPGRAPAWPAAMPGGVTWAYVSGAILIAGGTAILARVRARPAAIFCGTMIAGWALLRHIPLAAADSSVGAAWTLAGKALALACGAFAVAGSLPRDDDGPAGAGSSRGRVGGALVAAGRYGLGAFMILAGIQHFLFAAFVQTLVPVWVPWPLFWTYFAGVALIAGGVGLIVPLTARLAAAMSGLMIFLWLIMLHVPRAVAAPAGQVRNEWTSVLEALAFSGIAFVLTARRRDNARRPAPAGSTLSEVRS